MSWGHATSPDLVNWTEHEVALPYSAEEMVFSGSAVVDYDNTSGFGYGPNGEPPIVAIYTSATPGDQAQALAVSHDGGYTFERYEGNPVLDLPDPEFRDPKVFWQDNPGDDDYWVMAAVRAVSRQVEFYRSHDLKDWDLLSSFGPANAVGGVWECPDLIEMKVENTGETKWMLVVSLNPGGIQGGSATQYFIGDWDGVTFTADNVRSGRPASGTVLEGFESGTYDNWIASGGAFGEGPAQGGLPGQTGVTGYEGDFLVDSFLNDDGTPGDGGSGRLISLPFEITADYLNLKVGGGGHRWDLTIVPDEGAPGGRTLANFDFGLLPEGWTAEGDFAGLRPTAGNAPGQGGVAGFDGEGLLNTFNYPEGTGDEGTGTITSSEFVIDAKFINFKVGGGGHDGSASPDPLTEVQLIVGGEVVRTASGAFSETLDWESWGVEEFMGETVRIRAVDANSGGWGHVLLDSIELNDTSVLDLPPPTATVFEDWEVEGLPDGWTATGDFANGFGTATGGQFGQQEVTGFEGERLLNTFWIEPGVEGVGGDFATGTIVSDSFTVSEDWINLLVGGGAHRGDAQTTVNLVVDGETVQTASGREAEALAWTSWEVADYLGQEAHFEIIDNNAGGWGHINVDQIEFSGAARARQQASPTAVNLIVDGVRVATASGANGEALDWTSWDVSQWIGKDAQIEIVDYNTGGWGHINVDEFMLAGDSALASQYIADWVDYGADNYAGVSWHNLPEGEDPTLISWMNNWAYAGAIPTGDFRGSMVLPREYSLREIDGEVRLVQKPVEGVEALRRQHVAVEDVSLGAASLRAPLDGHALEIVATFDAAAAEAARFGVKVRVGDGEETVIGYDTEAAEVVVDRSASGFLPSEGFAATHTAPLEVLPDGTVKLHIFVDAASVEVFANDGLRTITDQIFPDPESVGVELFAEGGDAALASLDVWKLATGDDPVPPAPRKYVGTDGADLLAPFEGAKGVLRFEGRGGDDTIVGSARSDIVDAGSGNDIVRAGDGNDVAKGEAGDDWIAMGAGKVDLAWGGSGADIFFFGEQTSDGERGRTAIGDFEVGTDALDLSGAEVIAHKVILDSLILTLDGDHDQIVLAGVSEYEDSLFV
jgi:sucrose-6-phosphate hydrolase SacC (GH32 family)